MDKYLKEKLHLESENAVSINVLQFEILEIILVKLLNFEDRKRASVVCKLWNDITFSRRNLRNIILNLSEFAVDNRLNVEGWSIKREYCHVKVSNLMSDNSLSILRNTLISSAESLKHLELTVGSKCKINDFYFLLKSLSAIEELNLKIEGEIDNENFFFRSSTEDQSLPKLCNLKKLTLLIDISSPQKGRKKISSRISKHLILSFSTIAENLEELHIENDSERGYSYKHDDELTYLARVLGPRLRKLTFYVVDIKMFKTLKFPEIVELDLLFDNVHDAKFYKKKNNTDDIKTFFEQFNNTSHLKKLKLGSLIAEGSFDEAEIFNYIESVEDLCIQMRLFINVKQENVAKNVKKLAIFGIRDGGVWHVELANLFTHVKFPVLTDLFIDTFWYSFNSIEVISKSAKNIVSLRIYGNHYAIREEELCEYGVLDPGLLLLRWFPKLKDFMLKELEK